MRTATPITWSTVKKKIAAMETIRNTRPVVTIVSLRLGQVTLLTSLRTSRANFRGSKATLTTLLTQKGLRETPQTAARRWQGWQVSNLQPPVLETGALAN